MSDMVASALITGGFVLAGRLWSMLEHRIALKEERAFRAVVNGQVAEKIIAKAERKESLSDE